MWFTPLTQFGHEIPTGPHFSDILLLYIHIMTYCDIHIIIILVTPLLGARLGANIIKLSAPSEEGSKKPLLKKWQSPWVITVKETSGGDLGRQTVRGDLLLLMLTVGRAMLSHLSLLTTTRNCTIACLSMSLKWPFWNPSENCWLLLFGKMFIFPRNHCEWRQNSDDAHESGQGWRSLVHWSSASWLFWPIRPFIIPLH